MVGGSGLAMISGCTHPSAETDKLRTEDVSPNLNDIPYLSSSSVFCTP